MTPHAAERIHGYAQAIAACALALLLLAIVEPAPPSGYMGAVERWLYPRAEAAPAPLVPAEDH